MPVLRINIILILLFWGPMAQTNIKNTKPGRSLELGYRNITTCENYFIAVGTGGRIDRISTSGEVTKCVGITNTGEIVSSTDAINWNVFDYNKHYKGFNKPCSFKSIYVSRNWITIVGEHEEKTPVALFSPQGKVWTERSLNYTDELGDSHVFTDSPNDIGYDPMEDQFFIVCKNGSVSVLTTCKKCNTAHSISSTNLTAVACLDNFLMIVDEAFGIYPVRLR